MPPTTRPRYALAFDTSAYTTSVALVDSDGNILHDGRRILDVPQGKRGLRQSEALFQHVINLPDLLQQAKPFLTKYPPSIVASSTAPRPLPDSYMPVFRAGHGVARSIAAALNVPFLPLSHQEGHLWAAFLSLRAIPPLDEPFLAVHVSGGTTEALVGSLQANGRVHLTIAGATGDLSAGKFIDRVGVALGFDFPAGSALERCASSYSGEAPRIHPAVKESSISFSGPLTALEREMAQYPPEAIAWAAQHVVATGLARWSQGVVKEAFPTPPRFAYWVGGVAANTALRHTATELLQACGVQQVLFAEPGLSTDNALGVAYYAANQSE